jgi:hypothetical protein
MAPGFHRFHRFHHILATFSALIRLNIFEFVRIRRTVPVSRECFSLNVLPMFGAFDRARASIRADNIAGMQ